jgi:hypothetical protein
MNVIKPCPACGMMPDIRPIDTVSVGYYFRTYSACGRYEIEHHCVPRGGYIGVECYSPELYGPYAVIDFWNAVRDGYIKRKTVSEVDLDVALGLRSWEDE